jgi:hypothetical protein
MPPPCGLTTVKFAARQITLLNKKRGFGPNTGETTMGNTQIVSDTLAFDEVDELIEVLRSLKATAVALERGAVVYVRANEPFMNGTAYLECETLEDESTVYNVVINAG